MSQTDLVQTWIKKHAQLECLRDNDMADAFARELEQEDHMEDTLMDEQASQESVIEVPVPPVNAAVINSSVQTSKKCGHHPQLTLSLGSLKT